MITKTRKAIAASGATTENEPIIKSDGASSDVMQWVSNNDSIGITISEDDSDNLDLVVASGNATLNGGDNTSGVLTATENCNFKFQGGSNNDKGPNVELNTSAGTLLRIIREGRRAGGASNDALVQTGLATALKLGTNDTTRLTISSAGISSFTQATTTDTGGDGVIKLLVGDDSSPGWNLRLDSTNDASLSIDRRQGGTWSSAMMITRASGLATFSNGIALENGFLTAGDWGSGKTISSGAITATDSIQYIDTEGSAATDDLDTINGGTTGSYITLATTSSSRDVTLKDGTGNLILAGDFTMDYGHDTITLLKQGSNWLELSRSSNL